VDAVVTRDKAAELLRKGARSLAQALLAGPTAAFWSQRSFTVRAVTDSTLLHLVALPSSWLQFSDPAHTDMGTAPMC
jgi:hypothetical protein